MAASSLNAVRVRLYFDYPPPCMPDCRMSWLLVDLNKCRVVADLCSVIREKFDYSRKTALDLFIENCFLPPAESVYVVRDNDSIRVKVSSVPCEYAGKKRRREEEGSLQAPMKTKDEAGDVNACTPPVGAAKKKHKAKKKKGDESEDAYKAEIPVKDPSLGKSQTDKNGKKASAGSGLTNGKEISPDSSKEDTRKPCHSKAERLRKSSSSGSSSSENENTCVKKSLKPTTSAKTCPGTKKPKVQTSSVAPKSTAKEKQTSSDSSSSEQEASGPAAKKANPAGKSTSSSGKQKSGTVTSKVHSSSSSSSEEDGDSKKTSLSGKTSSVQNGGKSAALPQTRPPLSGRQGDEGKIPTSKKSSGSSSKPQVSSDSSSSDDEAGNPNAPATPKPVVENGTTRTLSTPLGTTLPDNKDGAENSGSDSSSDMELVIKKPNPQLMIGLTPRGRGRGFTDRMKGRGGVRGGFGFGRARGTPWKQNFHYNYDNEQQRKQNESQTNRSLVLQNPPEPPPRRDYSTLPLLAAPPAVGQKLVFKLLELNENYSPEVSDYKEAKIIGFNHSTNMVELELLTRNQVRTEPGKFDLVYQNPDGSERVEYAVSLGSQLTERWESLLEPRLIVQNAD